MLRNTFKAAWAHKRRLVSTVVSILLGVAFMTGTLVLGDTLDRSFDELFGRVLSETDVEVQGPVIFDSGFGKMRGPVDESVIHVIAAIEGVDAVGAQVEVRGVRVLNGDGEPIGPTPGPPTMLQAHVPDPPLSRVEMVGGRAPSAPDELVMNQKAAREHGFALNDPIALLTAEGERSFRLVGTFRVAGRDSTLGAVTVQVMLPVAQEINGQPDQVTSISVRSAAMTPEELVEQISTALGPDTDLSVMTGEEVAADRANDMSERVSFISWILLVFGFVALVVGAFIIFNTFSVLVAQRGRELALLRTLGAGRRQVFASVLIEAALIGLVAALIGIGIGLVLAAAVLAALSGLRLDLPSTTIAVTPPTLVLAMVAGMTVTLGSALVPAWRATRVAPLAALREVAHDDTGRPRLRLLIGLVLLGIAVLSAVPAFGPDPDRTAMRLVGLAVFVLLISLIVLGPLLARPLVHALGRPLPRLRGTTGLLARENAARNPKRTAATAAALMIGVGLVSFIYIFTASARASVDAELTRGLKAQYIVRSDSTNLGIPPTFARAAREIPGVAAVSTVRGWLATVEVDEPARTRGVTESGSDENDDEPIATFATAIDPANHRLAIDALMAEGRIDDLVPGTILVDRRAALDHDLSVGDTVRVTVMTGEERPFTVAAVGDDPFLLGGAWILHQQDWNEMMPFVSDAQIYVVTDPDADLSRVRDQLERAAESYPIAEVQDQDEYLGGIASQLNMILNVLLGLLALSVIIALIGIANTLSLSIHERTRELGLLRAVGMTRRQVRVAVRWEAALIALIGTIMGLALGLVTSFLLVEALKSEGLSRYSIPFGALLVVAVIFAALGMVASLLPARRAARLSILDAIGTE